MSSTFSASFEEIIVYLSTHYPGGFMDRALEAFEFDELDDFVTKAAFAECLVRIIALNYDPDSSSLANWRRIAGALQTTFDEFEPLVRAAHAQYRQAGNEKPESAVVGMLDSTSAAEITEREGFRYACRFRDVAETLRDQLDDSLDPGSE